MLDPVLRKDVKLLGNLVGSWVKQREGAEALDTVERIRLLSKRWRKEGDMSAFNTLVSVIDSLPPEKVGWGARVPLLPRVRVSVFVAVWRARRTPLCTSRWPVVGGGVHLCESKAWETGTWAARVFALMAASLCVSACVLVRRAWQGRP